MKDLLRFDGFYLCLDRLQHLGSVRILFFKPDRTGVRADSIFPSEIRQNERRVRAYIYQTYVKLRSKNIQNFSGFLKSKNLNRKVLHQPLLEVPRKFYYRINNMEISIYYYKNKANSSHGKIKTDSLTFSGRYELFEFVAFKE